MRGQASVRPSPIPLIAAKRSRPVYGTIASGALRRMAIDQGGGARAGRLRYPAVEGGRPW